MKRFLILGVRGQLGIELHNVFRDAGHVIAHSRTSCDLVDPSSILTAVRDAHPDVILNAAAYTAVDRAESEPDLAMRINGEAPGILAEEAKKIGALLVHYSTDYVFDGSKSGPWTEDDPVHPLSVYGATKLAGERNIQQAGGKFLIFRTSWVFSPHGHNFLRTMLRLGQEREELKIVNDQKGAPTSALALAEATHRLLTGTAARSVEERTGVYHMTCAGETTWYDFAKAIFAKAQSEKHWASVKGIPSSQYPTPAARPANSILSNQKLKAAFEIELPSWETTLDASLKTLEMQRGRIG
ncbi:MAG TPA: dTDP-4-dehydrorhamnose reductase [Acidobacteriaceae bacterium]|nr:dTDP-4-dehydrorhamnose reductase [Acidobacteriaceae bacterium]